MTKREIFATDGEFMVMKANEKSAILCSVDDEEIYGAEFYRLGFSECKAL